MPGPVGQRADAGQVGAPAVHRVQVELEVPRVQDDALGGVEGDGEGVGHRVGDRDELDVARADRPTLAVGHRDELGPVDQAGLLDPVAGQAEGQLRAVDRGPEVPQQEGQAPGVVLVAVGKHDAVDPVGVLVQVGEVGQHQVDAGHVGLGEHDPAVEDEDPPVDLDAGAVAADLAQAAEEDDPHRLADSDERADPLDRLRRLGSANAIARRERPEPGQQQPGQAVQLRRGRAHGSPALADGQAQGPAGRLGRAAGWGSSRSTRSRRTRAARALPATGRRRRRPWRRRRSCRRSAGRTSATATLTSPTAPDRQQGQGQGVLAAVDLEAGRGARPTSRAAPTTSPAASFTPRCWPRRRPAAAWCRRRCAGPCAPGCRRGATGRSVAPATARKWS